MYQAGLVWPSCKLYPIRSGSLTLWGFNASTAASDTLYGNVTSQWLREGATATARNPNLRQVQINPEQVVFVQRNHGRIDRRCGS